MKFYEYIKEFSIKYCDVDFKDRMKPSVALSYFEEVAAASAEELGFGYSFVKPNGYAFMVTSVCCEFVRPIALGERITVKTWPTPPSHVVFGREYQILSAEGEILINASSRWCLIDMNSGRILPSKLLPEQDYSTYNTKKVLDNIVWKAPLFQAEEGELKYTLTIANSDYDHNMHVNNTKYADYCFNCFSVQELSEKKLKRFAISYMKQCKEGETLKMYRKMQEDKTYIVQGFNQDGKVVVQAQILFEN